MDLLIATFIQILYFYFYLIIAYVLLGWIQEVRKSRFYEILGMLTEPFFRVFRGWLVFNGLDFTPMVGLMLYQYLLRIIVANI